MSFFPVHLIGISDNKQHADCEAHAAGLKMPSHPLWGKF